ncbi:Hypothetical protein CINCED_3A013431 [Cinara cedri]|nr:Hypothetical protein CINCED_3A013431 [Cinara cedri]
MQQMDGTLLSNGRKPTNQPYIKIIEQPASKALRFRYECEGRSAGSIPGVNSTPENKTYPTIQIVGYKGRAVVVVSCVTKDSPFRSHPHNLVGRDNCKKGICTIEINNDSMTASFQNLGIQCVKRKDIDEALKVREEIRVDPFRTGFSHKEIPTSIDLNAVRLCFQAFLGGAQKGKYSILEPVVSDPIYDKKAMSDLVICRLSDASASVAGGKDIILLCEKVTKDDIQVRFYEEKDGKCIWESYADFQPQDVHKQVAIYFRTPKYRTTDINSTVHVWIQLKRPSDNMCSEPRPFMLTPVDSGLPRRDKRQKLNESEILRQLQSDPRLTIPPSSCLLNSNQLSIPVHVIVKEDPDTSPNMYDNLYPPSNTIGIVQSPPMYNSRTPSPQGGYQFPLNITSSNTYYAQNSLSNNVHSPIIGTSTNCGSMSGCIITEVGSPHKSQSISSQTNSAPLTVITNSLPCPTEDNNEPIFMDTFSSLDQLDSSELREFQNDNTMEDTEQVLSANLCASLQLEVGSTPSDSNKVVNPENMNISDSTLDKIEFF